jgi:hypothetical protein
MATNRTPADRRLTVSPVPRGDTAVHDLAQADSQSAGVTLTTESPQNVALYRHFGYRVLGHARVSDELETWTFFRLRQ